MAPKILMCAAALSLALTNPSWGQCYGGNCGGGGFSGYGGGGWGGGHMTSYSGPSYSGSTSYGCSGGSPGASLGWHQPMMSQPMVRHYQPMTVVRTSPAIRYSAPTSRITSQPARTAVKSCSWSCPEGQPCKLRCR